MKTLPILSYKNMDDEGVRPVLITFVGYETNHESLLFSINDAKDVTSSLISVIAAIQDPKYEVSLDKPVI